MWCKAIVGFLGNKKEGKSIGSDSSFIPKGSKLWIHDARFETLKNMGYVKEIKIMKPKTKEEKYVKQTK